MKGGLSLAVVSLLALAGCQSGGGGGGGGSVAPASAGQVVAAGQMADFCRAQAASQFGLSLDNMATNDPVSAPGGGTLIKGQWTSPQTGDQAATFDCFFGPGGAFQRLSRTS